MCHFLRQSMATKTGTDLHGSSEVDLVRLAEKNSDEDGCLLGCGAVQSGRSLPTFHGSLLLPSSGR